MHTHAPTAQGASAADTPAPAAIWLRLLPAAIRTRLEGRLYLQKVLTNTGWLVFDKLLRMGVGFLVGVWVARYLGPERYGVFNYATAFVALFSAFATLGLDGIVVRDLVRNPEGARETLGSAFTMRLFGGITTLLLTQAVICLIRPHDHLTHMLVGIIAAGTVIQAFDTLDLWFQSQIRSKYTVYAKNTAFLLLSLVKIMLILRQAPLVAFAWVGTGELALGAIGMLLAYRIHGQSISKWRASITRGKSLLRDSWPLLVSGIAIGLFMKVDQVMLGQLLDNRAVGIYSAATRLCEVLYFVPTAIVSSVFPSIVAAKSLGDTLYFARLQKLFSLLTLLAYAIAIPMTLLSGWLVTLLFGPEYAAAGPVLAIYVWAGVFVSLGCGHGPYWLTENLQGFSVVLTFMAAVLKIGLNYAIIPHHREVGAAAATMISYAIPNTIALCLFKKTRPLFLLTIRALANPLGRIRK